VAAGNSYADHVHAGGAVPAGGHIDLGWHLLDAPSAEAEFEIWYAGADRLELELLDPDGGTVARLEPGRQGRVRDGGSGRTVIFLASRLGDPNNGDNVIGAFLEAGAAGVWTLRLRNPGAAPVPFHAWVERHDPAQSSFTGEAVGDDHTLGSISCGRDSIVVGSYDAHKPDTPLSWFSSAGPTRDGREKPEISAPGQDVLAAASRTGKGVVRKSGTSMAAPMVTGALALLLAEAHRQGRALPIGTLRGILEGSARPALPGAPGWDARLQALERAPTRVAARKGRRKQRRVT
jgi:hypothetical protein